MNKLTPIQVEFLRKGIVAPEHFEIDRLTGETTCMALRLLSSCYKRPNKPVHAPIGYSYTDEDISEKRLESSRVVDAALNIAANAGLLHFHACSETGGAPDGLPTHVIWEFRGQHPQERPQQHELSLGETRTGRGFAAQRPPEQTVASCPPAAKAEEDEAGHYTFHFSPKVPEEPTEGREQKTFCTNTSAEAYSLAVKHAKNLGYVHGTDPWTYRLVNFQEEGQK